MMETPCANLIERDTPECEMGGLVPSDCHRACRYYRPGLNDQEFKRHEKWIEIMRGESERV